MATRNLMMAALVASCCVTALADLYEVEPNDTFPGTHIGTLNNGENVIGSISPVNDEDFHYFDTAGSGGNPAPVLRRYVFDVETWGGDSVLFIYDTGPEGWILGENDDVEYPADLSSHVTFDLFDFGGPNTWGYWMYGYDDTFDYAMKVSWLDVVVEDGGTYSPGVLYINTCLSDFDTELAIYNAMGDLIDHNDDSCLAQSELTVDLSVGTYYLMAGGYNTRTPDDARPDGNWDRSGAGGGVDTAGGDLDLDIGGNHFVRTLVPGDRVWYGIEVVPEPGAFAALAAGLLGLLALRRRE
jgi:hypothetical protein